MPTSSIDTADVRLRIERHGPADAPVVVLVHGFPDHRGMWEPVVRRLQADHHVVTFDVRGAGASSAPERRSGYHVRHLVDDVAAVLEEVAPDARPVHLVGHDWGSVQGWAVLAREAEDPRLRGRIASFTSISGPGLELYGQFVRDGLRHGRLLTVGGQLARSWYVAAFQLPRVPEVLLSRAAGRLTSALTAREGLDRSPDGPHWGSSFVRDAVNGVNLYRANLPRVLARPQPTTVPVQLVVPTKDHYLRPAMYAGLERFAPDLRRVEVVAGHWVPRTQPDVVAGAVRDLVADLAREESRAG